MIRCGGGCCYRVREDRDIPHESEMYLTGAKFAGSLL